MNFYQPRKRKERVPIVPLIDILTILLIFFIVTLKGNTSKRHFQIGFDLFFHFDITAEVAVHKTTTIAFNIIVVITSFIPRNDAITTNRCTIRR